MITSEKNTIVDKKEYEESMEIEREFYRHAELRDELERKIAMGKKVYKCPQEILDDDSYKSYLVEAEEQRQIREEQRNEWDEYARDAIADKDAF